MTPCASATGDRSAVPALKPVPDSPSDRVGAAPSDAFGKIRHATRMLSLGNGFDDDDIADFVAGSAAF